MPKFFRALLLALVLMMVALISALTTMQMAIHGREVTVPKVVGLSQTDAERAGASSCLQLVIERQFYSTNVPEGKIMTQVPLAGTKVRRGWSLRVAQSLGPQRVVIPDVTAGSERAAELNVRRRGLAVGSVAYVNLPDAPQDQVVSQSPTANASGVSTPKINLLVSAGNPTATYVMPDLTGQPLGSATIALQEAGVHVGKVSVVSVPSSGEPQTTPVATEPSPAAMIVTQSPAAGQKIGAGSTVNFEVR